MQSESGYCVAAQNPGATVVGQACSTSASQKWNFVGGTALNLGTSTSTSSSGSSSSGTSGTSTTTPTSSTNLGTFSLQDEAASQANALTVLYGTSSEGDPLITYWAGATGGSMNVLSVGSSQYEIQEIGGGRCMTVNGAGSAVTITTCTGSANQLFALNAQTDGSYGMQSESGYCVAAQSPGATVVGQACSTSASQKWNFVGGTALNLGTSSSTSITNSPTVPAGYHLTFDDEFQSLSISDTNGAGTKWYSKTIQCCLTDTSNPGTPAYMAGVGSGPGEDPFSIVPGQGLDIRLQKANGAWYSGVVATVDSQGSGFSQQYGYFEVKAMFPSGAGTWPAFWLLNAAHLIQGAPAGEIDVVEAYMQFPTIMNTTLEDWGASTHLGPFQSQVANMSNGFHVYGLLWTASTMTFYFDGAVVCQTPTPSVMNQPYYVILDLGLGGGWPTNQTPQQSDMVVQYVRAYSD
jgi:hypothetical protein